MLQGKVVVITGAGAGIGVAMAQAFHAAGALVAMGDLRHDKVERAAADLGPERSFAGAVDVRDDTSVRRFFAAAEQALGPVEVEEWDRVIETNLRGTFLTCRAAARSMTAGGRPGKIITVSSGAYASARPGASHYCASKSGIVMFTKTLAMELAQAHINVNCIAPGYIQLDPTAPDSEFRRALLQNIPWGRFGTPAEVADIALFLASSAADYVTGEVFAVNGGAFAGRMYLPLNTATAR